MKRLGLIGRADFAGGIANQSYAIAQHLEPYISAALVLDMSPGDRGRGPFDARPWFDVLGGRVIIDDFPFSDACMEILLRNSDVVFAVEGPPPGWNHFGEMCAAAGVEFVIHCNPELFQPAYLGATTRLMLPTTWHAERFPDATLLPMPVDRVRFPYRRRTEARTFVHVSAPAFHDRAGTALLMESFQHVQSPCTFIMHGVRDVPGPLTDQIGNVTLRYVPPVADNRDVYPASADVLVVPRRYGGLALYAQEAASLGLPLVTLDLPPLNERPGVVTVPCSHAYPVAMIGGEENVWCCDPAAIASAIDSLAGNPDLVRQLSNGADDWARENSWPALLPTWLDVLAIG